MPFWSVDSIHGNLGFSMLLVYERISVIDSLWFICMVVIQMLGPRQVCKTAWAFWSLVLFALIHWNLSTFIMLWNPQKNCNFKIVYKGFVKTLIEILKIEPTDKRLVKNSMLEGENTSRNDNLPNKTPQQQHAWS